MGINFSKVGFTYFPYKKQEKNVYVIEDVNLNVPDSGELITILGHTGSGKSTLIQLMNALLLPTTGEIDIAGNVITAKKHDNLKQVRKDIGLVFQFPEYQLFEETVLKDVSFGPKNFRLEDPEKRAKDALALFSLKEEYYEKNPFRLSGGEMRKVAISGILASDPKVLILDEPTVGLDPSTKKDLISLLKEICFEKNKTIIIVTHDMDVVWDVATRVIVLDDKKIVFDGDKESLFKDEEFLYKHSLDLPNIIKIMKQIKGKLNIDINIYQKDVTSAYQELELRLNNE